ncbi:MAG: hypothetical protein AMJ78_03250 [Omnitrophica WOR_2 bacterium SM23_29]|nr:MAG: hypothetical protein AMJ78_03250 [Omnitrophica WOR_2 bacterium SM23_29]
MKRVSVRNNCICIFLSIFLLAGSNPQTKAAEVLEEETTPKYLGAAQKKAYEKAEVVKGTKVFKTKYFFAAAQGYDNNVNLDSQRKGDTFSEGIFDAEAIYPITGRWDVFGGVGVHDITYWDVTDASLVDTDLRFGFEGKFFGTVTLTALNDFEIIEYPYNEDGSYIGDKVGFKIKHLLPKTYLPATFFHSFGYEYFYKNYMDRKASNGYGAKSPNDRVDKRHTLDCEFGAYFKKAMLKFSGEYYFNDSNDQYLSYYDYQSRRIGLSLIYLLTDKMTAILSAGHQRKHFIHRITRVDNTKLETDKIFTAGASIFYDIYKNVSLGLNYFYRENDSNDPIQEYSGSITSLGLYCRF